MTLRRHHVWIALSSIAFACALGANYFLLLSACGVLVAPERSWFRDWVPAACSIELRTEQLDRERERYRALTGQMQEAELAAARMQGACARPLPAARAAN